MSHKVEVDHLDRGPQGAAGLLPVIFSVTVWFLSGRLFMLESPASRGGPWGHTRQSELAFPLEDPAALYISGQIWCSLYEGLNFIIRMTASPLCCNSAGMSAFTPFCQQPNYSFLPLGSCPSFSIMPTLSWLRADRAALFSILLRSPTNLAFLELQGCWRGSVRHGEQRSLGSSSPDFESKIGNLLYDPPLVSNLMLWTSVSSSLRRRTVLSTL